MKPKGFRRLAMTLVLPALLVAGLGGATSADGAVVARGDLRPFATGGGLDLSGRAQLIRTAAGSTIVVLHVEGLAAATTYGAHVHKQACADGDADGHYRFDPNGPAAPPNEIWASFTTNEAGIGNSRAVVAGVAGPSAVALVVHAPGGAKIACADLR